ncbi:MAG TPA: SRPBCC domain-containing protein [Candidatus Acidoferrales bacterium]|nr:SRPBCC domain-containing protein [Candidatus Acidoferrales bacterium]
MTKAIQQSTKFNATPQALYEMYMDSKQHSAATGGSARLSRKPGGEFTAWNGMLRGKNLLLVPNRMIVQAWRSCNFPSSAPDSILILSFTKEGSGTRVDLVHVNVPPQDYKGVSKGWPTYYWKPWKRHLAKQK